MLGELTSIIKEEMNAQIEAFKGTHLFNVAHVSETLLPFHWKEKVLLVDLCWLTF